MFRKWYNIDTLKNIDRARNKVFLLKNSYIIQ